MYVYRQNIRVYILLRQAWCNDRELSQSDPKISFLHTVVEYHGATLKNLSDGYWSELHYPDLTSSPPEYPGLSITPISLPVYANKLNLFWLIHLNPNWFTG